MKRRGRPAEPVPATSGRWTVLRREGSENGRAVWLCRCECGSFQKVKGSSLRAGRSSGCRSCGTITANEKRAKRRQLAAESAKGAES